MADDQVLLRTMRSIASGDRAAVLESLDAAPALAAANLVTGGTRRSSEDHFLDECSMQLYAGDTALHVAAAAYDTPTARRLVALGADVRARNRRGGEPLHAATNGNPSSGNWDPERQAAVIRCLIEVGADPNASAAGGVTPLHRAVRNRCASAVRALLDGGAEPSRRNDRGSTAVMLASWTTGRGGSGTPSAKAQQAEILRLLESW